MPSLYALITTFIIIAVTYAQPVAPTGLQKNDRNSPDSSEVQNPVIRNYNQATDTILRTSSFLIDDTWKIISSPARINKTSAKWLSGFLLTAGILYAYDDDLFEKIQSNRNDEVWEKIINTGTFFEPAGLTRNTYPYYLAGYFTGYVLGTGWMQEASLQLLESMVIEGNTRVGILHRLFGRARPSTGRGARFFKFDDDRSFPSGHTSNIFQLATVLSYHIDNPFFTIFAYGAATTVGLQRIDVRSHWPSDVFVGAVYGTVISRSIIYFHENRKTRLYPRISQECGTLEWVLSFRLD